MNQRDLLVEAVRAERERCARIAEAEAATHEQVRDSHSAKWGGLPSDTRDEYYCLLNDMALACRAVAGKIREQAPA